MRQQKVEPRHALRQARADAHGIPVRKGHGFVALRVGLAVHQHGRFARDAQREIGPPLVVVDGRGRARDRLRVADVQVAACLGGIIA